MATAVGWCYVTVAARTSRSTEGLGEDTGPDSEKIQCFQPQSQHTWSFCQFGICGGGGRVKLVLWCGGDL